MSILNYLLLYIFSLFCLLGCAQTHMEPIDSPKFSGYEKDEKSLWNSANEFEEFFNQNADIYEDKQLEDYLNRIAKKLFNSPFVNFRIKIVQDTSLNAFALPNGAIYITSGILSKIENEDQLATLLGHEMSHVILRHSIAEFRSLKNKTAVFNIMSVSLLIGGINIASLGQSIGLLITKASIQGYSRIKEAEADVYGLKLMTNAGYNPREGIKLYNKLLTEIKEQKIKEPYFFSSHPKVADRIQSLKKIIEQNYYNYEPSKHKDIYMILMKEVFLINSSLDIDAGRYLSAKHTLEKLIQNMPNDPTTLCLMGRLIYNKRTNQPHKAEKFLLKAIKSKDNVCNDICCPYKYLGLIYWKDNNSLLAAKYFKLYLDKFPNCKDNKLISKMIEYCKRK